MIRYLPFIGNRCRACGRCAENCPTGAVIRTEREYQIDPARCISCWLCSRSCPNSAVERQKSEKEPSHETETE